MNEAIFYQDLNDTELFVPNLEKEETACKIEHVISKRILNKWKKHIKNYLKEEQKKTKN